ncbi:Eco57I restriction-modification methylase domain-containing protein, partial [Pseudoalteromonas sp. SR45-6]|uniref:Eco57I restriction-modification methylase domain-containing protein n=1 Tax=Pseudoalteromonas sp. SR45-6 TaxID=2760927 RepID=UPI0015FF09A6
YEEARHIFEAGGNLDNTQKELIEDIWNDLRYAYKFGSLIRLDEKLKAKLKELEAKQGDKVLDLFADADIREQKDFTEKFFNNLKAAVEQFASKDADTFIASKTRDAITFLELLTTEYDVACANPPYTDSADFGVELKVFLDLNYKKPHKFNTNLYVTFIKRSYDFVGDNGLIAMVHPPTFMYIKKFEDVRKFMIDKTHINLFVEWGYLGMFNPSARVDSALYVLEKNSNSDRNSIFIKLNHLYETKRYDALCGAYENLIKGQSHDLVYIAPQTKLKIIKSYPFIYWISDEFRDKFGKKTINNISNVVNGVKTGNNERLLRFWWEISESKNLVFNETNEHWMKYAKGGPFKKWYGNVWLCLNYINNGGEIKKSKNYCLLSEENSFRSGITYSDATSKGVAFRVLENDCMFDMSGPAVLLNTPEELNYTIGIMNTSLVYYVADCLNSTVHTQIGDIKRIPFIESKKSKKIISRIAATNIEIMKYLAKYSLVENNFSKSPLINGSNFKESLCDFLNMENFLHTQIFISEAILNEKAFDIFSLTDADIAMVKAKEGESIGILPVCEIAKKAYLEEYCENKQFPLIDAFEFIETLDIRTFSDEERAKIEGGFPTLYQSNNDLEDFCIKNKINPINIWYWFKTSKITPKQRMNKIALEFLVDLIRELLFEDEDGIIPLVANSGEKILLDRVEEKFREKGFSLAQYSSFDSVIGQPLNTYLYNQLFASLTEHLNLFMYLPKTPFIWHLSSGKEGGFDCYISIYKWSRDNLLRIRSVYIEHRERALINRQSDLANNESVDAQNEKDKIFKQLKEIETFKIKIDELLEDGYNPILDDGVGKNIAPLQKKKMLAYDVLSAGQLKKYLNADW